MSLASGPGMTLRLLLLLPAIVLSACGLIEDEEVNCAAVLCVPCGSPVVVRLHFPAGQTRADAVLEGIQGNCDADGNLTVCHISADKAGTYEFDVKATGYQKAHVRKAVPETKGDNCCMCGYVSQAVDVELAPE